MLPVTLDGPAPLRSTPRSLGSRDAALFPEAAALSHQQKTPFYYWLWVSRRTVVIGFDGFFLPLVMQARLENLYTSYVEWWLTEARAKRCWFPPRGVVSGTMRDYVSLTVLREHAEWWITLMRTTSLFCLPHPHSRIEEHEDEPEEIEVAPEDRIFMAPPLPVRIRREPTSSDRVRVAERRHARWQARGVRIGPSRSDHVIAEDKGRRVLVIAPEHGVLDLRARALQRRRGLMIARRANTDLRYDSNGWTSRAMGFIGLEGAYAVAWLSMTEEPASEIVWADEASWVPPRDGDPRRWTVTRIWVLPAQRRQGWARWPLEVASAQVGACPEELGWMAPLTDDGRALAEAIRPGRTWLA
jgi:hypothetical protein